MQFPTLSNSSKYLLNPSSDRLWRPYMMGTMFSYGYLLATSSTIPHGLQAESRGHLVLILYKAYKPHYCLDKPSVKRRTQTFTRSLSDRVLPLTSLSKPAPYCSVTVCHYVID